MKAVGVAVGLLMALLAAVVGGVVLIAGALVVSAEDAPIPPELEAAYRQVGYRTGVPWAAWPPGMRRSTASPSPCGRWTSSLPASWRLD